jgi:hypothetical protein
MPTSRFVVNHLLATYAARSKEGFVFVPDESLYQTYAIFRSANTAWQHDKLPVLAVCAFSKSPIPFQRETGIQADTADQFLSDLTLAHRIVPKLGASPAYIVRHNHGSNDQYDDIILPAHANLVVYQPHALSPTQLTRIFDHVANVRGKVILCDDRSAFANSYPELNEAVDRSLSKSIPPELRRNFDLPKPHGDDQNLHIDSEKPYTIPNQLELIPQSEAAPTVHNSHLDRPPAQSLYVIHHAKSENPAGFPNDYDLAAIIKADNIQCAVALSQHYGFPWPDNPGVVSFIDKPRSTQPGDVIVHDGIAQRFDGNGFQRIEPVISPQPLPTHDPAPSLDAPTPQVPRKKIGW